MGSMAPRRPREPISARMPVSWRPPRPPDWPRYCPTPSVTAPSGLGPMSSVGPGRSSGRCGRSAGSPTLTGPGSPGSAPAAGYHAPMTVPATADNHLTLVVAAFNEADSLPLLQPRLAAALDAVMQTYGVAGSIL